MEQVARIHIERLPEGFYLATSDDIPGLVAQGRTITETLEIARDVAKKLMELQNHPGDMPEGTLRAILKQADIVPDEFLET
jgi:predicted RNase H-like HicB family nuclease